MRKGILIGALGVLIYSCGGGGGSSDIGSISSSFPTSGSSSSYVKVLDVSVDRQEVNLGDTFNVSFSLDYNTSVAMVHLYLSSTQELPQNKGNYQIGYKNCYPNSLNGFADCGTQGTFQCEYSDLSGNRYVKCGISGSAVFLQNTGNKYLILEACIWNESFQEVCTKKEVSIRFNP